MMDASVLRLHEYRVKKLLLVMCRFHLFKRVHLVFPCQILVIREENAVAFSYDSFLPFKIRGRQCCIAASSSLSSSIGRWGDMV